MGGGGGIPVTVRRQVYAAPSRRRRLAERALSDTPGISCESAGAGCNSISYLISRMRGCARLGLPGQRAANRGGMQWGCIRGRNLHPGRYLHPGETSASGGRHQHAHAAALARTQALSSRLDAAAARPGQLRRTPPREVTGYASAASTTAFCSTTCSFLSPVAVDALGLRPMYLWVSGWVGE